MGTSQTELIIKIISDQEAIIGPLASDLAHSVVGIEWTDGVPSIIGDTKRVISELVNVYSNVFGQSSIEVCKDTIETYDSNLSREIFSKV
jgi:hypothetical protein